MDLKWGKLKIIGASLAMLVACAVVGVSLYAYLNKTLTWLANNRKVEATDMGVGIEEESALHVASMYVYRYEISEDHVIVKREVDPSRPEQMTLNEYDTVFVERQPYTPMVVKVPVERTQGKAFKIHITCNGALTKDGKMVDNLSNLIFIKCGMSANLDNNFSSETTKAEDFYKAAKTFFNDSTKQVDGTESNPITQLGGQDKYCIRRFTTYSGGALSEKKMELVIEVGDHDVRTYEGQGDQNQANIYLYLDYDPGLTAKFLEDNLPTIHAEYIEGGESVKLKSDLATIQFGECKAYKK